MKLLIIVLFLCSSIINAQDNGSTNQETRNRNLIGTIEAPNDKKNAEKRQELMSKGYLLENRVLIKEKDFTNNCKESGKVAVRIEVDRSGKVKKALSGVLYTTTNSKCLRKLAKKKAMAMHFNPDNNAPEIQTGNVLIKFSQND